MGNGISKTKIQDTIGNEYKKIDNLELNDDLKNEIKKYISQIGNDQYENTYEQGSALEQLVRKIFEGTKIFKCILNKHTSSNEFDVLVKLNFNGRKLRSDRIIPSWIPDKFLIECKNYKGYVNVGLVGKFYSLMEVSNVNMGIFISRCGVSGKFQKGKKEPERYWKDAMAFINKINLKYSQSQNPKILLDLTLDEIANIIDTNIVDIIECRKDQIDMDVNSDIIQWINPHENQGKFNQ